jgi:putative sigma-54 modulation protein
MREGAANLPKSLASESQTHTDLEAQDRGRRRMKHATATFQLSSAVTTTPIRGYMQFESRARGVSISHALSNHIERRVHFALDLFAVRIRQVHATVGDLNGPRGGIDKCCKLAISLGRPSTIVVESHDSNVYAAIDGVAHKAATCVGRRLKRSHGRNPLRRISGLLFQESPSMVVPSDPQPGDAP